MLEYKSKNIGGSFMSDLSSTSCNRNGGCGSDGGFSPIILILLLTMCGGGNGGGLFGGFGGNNGCGGGCDGGLDGILPLILILCLCGGSF
jgi:hypothetical protein